MSIMLYIIYKSLENVAIANALQLEATRQSFSALITATTQCQ